MACICKSLSAFLSVEDLRINTTRRSSEQDDSDRNHEEWLGIFREFRGVKWLHAGGWHSTSVVHALQLSVQRYEPVLPALQKLCIQEPEPRPSPLREAIVSYVHSCWLSGRFIAVEFENLSNSGLPRTGMTYAKCHHLTLNHFEQVLFPTRPLLRCFPTTSFSTYFFTFWMTPHSSSQHLYTCPKDGDSSSLHHLLV